MNKTRPLGRPKTRWINLITRDLKEIDHNVTFELTYNRDEWRDLLKAATVLNGPVNWEEDVYNFIPIKHDQCTPVEILRNNRSHICWDMHNVHWIVFFFFSKFYMCSCEFNKSFLRGVTNVTCLAFCGCK